MAWPKKKFKYTAQECAETAKLYSTKKEWSTTPIKHHQALYQFAQRQKLLNQYCSHMVILRPHLAYTLETCKKSALKYHTRTSWQQSEDNKFYQHAKRHSWLNQCCAHMSPHNSENIRFMIYLCLFPDSTAYVGVTRSPKYRAMQHRLHGKLHDHSQKVGQFTFTILEKDLKAAEATLRETYWQNYYRAIYTLLNRCRGGSLGGFTRKYNYTFEDCVNSARQFQYRSDWKTGAFTYYHYAQVHGWLDQCCAHMPTHMPRKIQNQRKLSKFQPRTDLTA